MISIVKNSKLDLVLELLTLELFAFFNVFAVSISITHEDNSHFCILDNIREIKDGRIKCLFPDHNLFGAPPVHGNFLLLGLNKLLEFVESL